MVTVYQREMDKLLEDKQLKAWYDFLMSELKAEQELSKKLIPYMNTEPSCTVQEDSCTVQDEDDYLGMHTLKWVVTLPKPKNKKDKPLPYELCNDRTETAYGKLNTHIIQNREGYSPVIYCGYKLSIIKTGIMRRKIK